MFHTRLAGNSSLPYVHHTEREKHCLMCMHDVCGSSQGIFKQVSMSFKLILHAALLGAFHYLAFIHRMQHPRGVPICFCCYASNNCKHVPWAESQTIPLINESAGIPMTLCVLLVVSLFVSCINRMHSLDIDYDVNPINLWKDVEFVAFGRGPSSEQKEITALKKDVA